MGKPQPLLVWITLAVVVLLVGVSLVLSRSELPDAIQLNTKGQPTIGYTKAKVHVVVFEEPKCSNCRDYNDLIFPKIKEDYIDTNKIRYTVIPVSFLPGSMPAATALLCVYYADPIYPNSDLYFTYFDYIYTHQPEEHSDWAQTKKLVAFAKATSPAINLQKLAKCIDMETYRIKIEKNTEYGRSIMGGRISTPTVYVNGIQAPEISYDAISKLIEEVMAHEGVH